MTLTNRQRLAELGIGAAWLIGIRASLLLVAWLVESSPLAEAVLGALVCDVAAGRAGLAWSTDDDEPDNRTVRSRAGYGLLLGAGLATLVVGVALVGGWARLSGTTPSAMALLGLVSAGALAIRDEILFRGLPILFAHRAGLPLGYGVVFGVLVAPSNFLLTERVTPEAVVLAMALGALAGALFVRKHGLWAAVAAHAGFVAVAGVLTRGALIEVTWQQGELGAGLAARGAPAWLMAALFSAAALVVWRGRTSAPDKTPAPSVAPKRKEGARTPAPSVAPKRKEGARKTKT